MPIGPSRGVISGGVKSRGVMVGEAPPRGVRFGGVSCSASGPERSPPTRTSGGVNLPPDSLTPRITACVVASNFRGDGSSSCCAARGLKLGSARPAGLKLGSDKPAELKLDSDKPAGLKLGSARLAGLKLGSTIDGSASDGSAIHGDVRWRSGAVNDRVTGSLGLPLGLLSGLTEKMLVEGLSGSDSSEPGLLRIPLPKLGLALFFCASGLIVGKPP